MNENNGQDVANQNGRGVMLAISVVVSMMTLATLLVAYIVFMPPFDFTSALIIAGLLSLGAGVLFWRRYSKPE